jgi:transglutaminase-like putative cysteine protease
MRTWERLTLAAALATALAATSLAPVYADLGWLVRVLGAVLAVATTAAVARSLGAPRPLQPLLATLGLAAYVLVVFARNTLAFAFVPTGDTLTVLRATLDQGLLDVQELGPPVPTRPGLVLLAVLGVGAVAVVVDLVAVPMRRAAAAGLPLLLVFAVPAAVLPGGVGVVPFLLGAAGWLGLLLTDGSDRVARWGTSLQSASQRRSTAAPSLGRAGRRISVAALGVAVVVPAVLPGLDGRLLGGTGGDGPGSGARSTTTYNPLTRLAGQLRLPEPETLLSYRTDATADYLRLTTLDVFDEDEGWSSSELSGDVEDDAVAGGIPSPTGQSRTATRTTTTDITVTGRLDGPWLPVPFPPEQIDVEGPWIWDAEAETVFSTRTEVGDLEDPYVVTATPIEPTPTQLRRASTAPEGIRKTYGQPPQITDYVRELIARTTAGLDNDYDRAVSLQALFRDPANGFRYDVNASTPGENAPDALENFLRGRVGFCEQYASAMAAITRSLGMPSRVAVGFIPGRPQPDGSYEVTTSEAHAWPEIWFGGAGWVRFEPTPRGNEVSTPSYSTPSADDEQAAPSADGPSAPAAPAPAAPSEGDIVDRAAEDGVAGGAGGAGQTGPGGRLLLALPVVLLVLASPALIAAARRRSRLRSGDPRMAWQVLQDDASDVGHRFRPADSPRAAAHHLRARRALGPAGEAALLRLAAAAEHARYARPDAAAPAAGGGALHDDVATVRSALLGTSGREQRWQARLLPSSLLRWVGSRLDDAAAAGQTRLDRGRLAVVRQVRARVLGRSTS